MSNQRTKLHLGPVMPGWGSWEWLGEDMIPAFQQFFDVETFTYDQPPPRDGVTIVIKHAPPLAWQHEARAHRSLIIYCPVDHYGSLNEIDLDVHWLTSVRHVIVHCHRLLPYFLPYAPTSYVNHQLRFVPEEMVEPVKDGPILWVGVYSNLPPLVEWLQSHTLPAPLLVLTNLPAGTTAIEAGFSQNQDIRMETWTPEGHLKAVQEARAAMDVKGIDFRSRHKPPTKALDFLACGLPLAMPTNSSSSEYLQQLGFQVATPDNIQLWSSSNYRSACQEMGHLLRQTCSRTQIAELWYATISTITNHQFGFSQDQE